LSALFRFPLQRACVDGRPRVSDEGRHSHNSNPVSFFFFHLPPCPRSLFWLSKALSDTFDPCRSRLAREMFFSTSGLRDVVLTLFLPSISLNGISPPLDVSGSFFSILSFLISPLNKDGVVPNIKLSRRHYSKLSSLSIFRCFLYSSPDLYPAVPTLSARFVH